MSKYHYFLTGVSLYLIITMAFSMSFDLIHLLTLRYSISITSYFFIFSVLLLFFFFGFLWMIKFSEKKYLPLFYSLFLLLVFLGNILINSYLGQKMFLLDNPQAVFEKTSIIDTCYNILSKLLSLSLFVFLLLKSFRAPAPQ